MFIHHYKEATGPYWVAAWVPEMDDKIFDFCYNNFGPGLGEHRVRHPSEHTNCVHRWVNDIKWGEVRFSREEDLMWFVLRWA